MSEQISNSQYILTQDTQSMFAKLNPEVARSNQFTDAANQYLSTISDVLQMALGDEVEVKGYYDEEINRRLREKVQPFIDQENTLCICLDRYLLAELEQDESYAEKFTRFSMSRSLDGQKVPRPSELPFEQQVAALTDAVEGKKVVVVDDGFFSGRTIKDFLDTFSRNGVNLNIERIIGFISNGAQVDESIAEKVEVLERISKLYDWIDIRDFSPMGGKIFESSCRNRVVTSVPYLYPWSEGAGASLNMSPKLFDISRKMITAFRTVIDSYESVGESLTFRQLVKAGFSLPTDTSKRIPVSINDRVTDYLDRCIYLIDTEQQRAVRVYDMDGTLYQLDGENNGYKRSTLEQCVLRNAKQFIMTREGCTSEEASATLQKGLNEKIGVSSYLAEKYGISRTEYFDEVWNIDPVGIVRNFQPAQSLVRIFKQASPSEKTILLTSAPRIWAEKVLEYIGIRDVFEQLYTGEQYGTKEEIFALLAGRYNPSNIMSIGDQEATDILPAQKYGINGILIKSPSDLEQLTIIVKGGVTQ
jgi:FMN phosphatase YigB (HAD superfamily)